MKKNILIITDSYPPINVAGAQRPYAISKYLSKKKFNISVITWANPITYFGINPDFDSKLEGVNVLRIESRIGGGEAKFITKGVKNNQNLKSRIKKSISSFLMKFVFPDKGMFWFPNVKAYLKQNKELINNADIVFSTSPHMTNHQIARWIKRQNPNMQWIADFRDFNYVKNWESKKGIKASLHKKLEASIVKEATYLTFVTQTMQKAYQQFYPQYQHKIHCVYNGFDKGDFPAVSEPLNEKLSFFYAGSFYNGVRSPFPLMQLLDKAFEEDLLTKEEVQVQIAGSLDEEMKTRLKDYKSFDCIKFFGSVPRTEALKYMCKTTFLWLIVGNIKSHYQTVPIKLFEYIAAKRPIVNFAPTISESSQIIKEKNLGYNFNTLDFDLGDSYPIFKDLILKYKAGNYNQSMPEENLDSFTWVNQVQQLENIL